MHEPQTEVAGILRFQQSLLRLVTRGSQEQAQSKNDVSDHARQLEDWALKVRPQSK